LKTLDLLIVKVKARFLLTAIEQRAQPVEYNDKSDPYWRCRSMGGFLEPNETFKQRLKADWTT